MRPNITIAVPEPFIPLNEYCRRTGTPLQTARDLIAAGRLPIREKDPKRKQGAVFINMIALTIEAAASCNISLEAK
ncbi:regulator [Morganella morganii]